MEIRVGCLMTYEFAQVTPIILMLNVHASRVADLTRPDTVVTTPPVPMAGYHDGFGNWCTRLVAPAGRFTIQTDGIIRDSGQWETPDVDARQVAIPDLTPETLVFLLGSRYCETDLLSETAWTLFGQSPPGWARVQAICDYVHDHIAFGYEHSRATRTAAEAFEEKRGVCRDYAHLALTFCRCLNIPARYCTGYISDIGLPQPHAPQDFAAWIEVFLDGSSGGRWHAFDPRNNDPRIGRILMARGRDAGDVPLSLTFGQHTLTGFQVTVEEVAAPLGPHSA
ncbi:transglutaminase family protein [Nitrospirillum sp. BR 11163]|uniref:transglutaminase-like domain-containing protein n=1 Tax=Nitrospirillum sp. BR 11163 TaxID=3104323 RepID=UPI002AFF7A53|nr:transglutaminase family protein [Nitrospirillum sp. BR 11163]MEA1671926.1 transglutaminase family protein [Nitrospirillum sp. BR 11163]